MDLATTCGLGLAGARVAANRRLGFGYRKTRDRRLPQYLASAHVSPCAVCCWQKLSTQPQSSQPDTLNPAWVKLFCATFRHLPPTGLHSMLHDVTSSDPGSSFPFLKHACYWRDPLNWAAHLALHSQCTTQTLLSPCH